jgi:carbonic anhydrase/acetyltransferase-like protein (isoleucine patch superfamily)
MASLIEHEGKQPQIHDSAYVAPTAALCGDVSIGEGTCVLSGATLTAESGPVEIGSHCIIMENAVVRGVKRQPVRIGNYVLVGPHAHLSGCVVEDEVYIATGATILNGAHLEMRSTVRINGIVHARTRLPAGVKMPIGWIAVGNPVEILPPDRDKRIAELLLDRGFSKTAFGLEPSTTKQLTERYARSLGKHRSDTIL